METESVAIRDLRKQEQAEESAKMRELRKEYIERRVNNPELDSDYYILVCFRTAKEKEGWLRDNSLAADTRMVTADRLTGLQLQVEQA
jgi:hypothetical protein